ncbi:MAG: YbaK/EbsC family protein [Chloroflexi bacterium]|nr:YbaK/EbsC family protein [Chloroflexota bacterium]
MSKTMSASAQKVQQALNAFGLALEVVELPQSTRTATEAAQAAGCSVGQIVKSLVFRGKESGRAVLVLTSGANRVNEQTLAQLLAEPVQKADPDFVRQRTGFSIGGVPPLGHVQPLPTFIDQDLMSYSEIWAAAGTPNAVFRLTPADLVEISSGQVVSVK